MHGYKSYGNLIQTAMPKVFFIVVTYIAGQPLTTTWYKLEFRC